MSLTSHLKSADSPVRIFLEGVSPLLAQAKGASREAKEASKTLGFDTAVALKPGVTLSDALSARQWSSPIGAAFDYRVRMSMDESLGNSGLDTELAEAGISTLRHGTHEHRIFIEALKGAQILYQSGDPEAVNRATIVLAWCESLFRAGPMAMAGSLGDAVSGARDGASLVRSIPPLVLDDLQRLLDVGGAQQIETWIGAIGDGTRYLPHPIFSGSPFVGGADGDWIIGDTLIDCKTTARVTKPLLRGHLLQLLGYVLLDENDDLGIRQVAVWLPRYSSTLTWTLDELLGADPDEALPALRAEFMSIARLSAWALV